MQDGPNSFTFKENVLIRGFICLFFGLAALIITVAALIKIKDNLLWVFPALGAGLFAFSLFYFLVNSVRQRQIVTVTPTEIVSRSRSAGIKRIAWQNITDIREVQTRIERVRSAAPLIEVMLSMYINLPFLAAGERRALLVFEAGPDNRIALRQHLIYQHRLDELRRAGLRYAPPRNPTENLLKVNSNN